MKHLLACLLALCLACPCLRAQSPCQIKIPQNVNVIRKNAVMERNGLGKTYWICNNSRVTFRTGDATLFVESGSFVSLNDGQFTVYAKDGANVYVGIRCQITLINEPRARINGTFIPTGQVCPVLNYDYSEAPDNLCTKFPLRELSPDLPAPPPEEPVRVPSTVIETPKDTAQVYDDRYRLPAQTTVVNQQKNLYESQGVFWVCSGMNFWLNGNGNRIYIEKGANVTVMGNKNVILLKAGGALHLPQGGANELLYEQETDLKTNRAKQTKFTKLQGINFKTEAVQGGCK